MRRAYAARLLIALLGACVAVCARALPEPTPAERGAYLQAAGAIARGDVATWRRLEPGLRDYPLYPYLELALLRRDLGPGNATAITAYLRRYEGQLPGERLRGAWLDALESRGRWQDYLQASDPGSASVETRCTRVHALWQTGNAAEAAPAAEALWLSPRSLPTRCDRAFAPWLARGNPRPEVAWRRIELALSAGEGGLARYLTRFLDASRAADGRLLQEVESKPSTVTQPARFRAGHAPHARIAAFGITRLAASDAAGARRAFDALARAGVLDDEAQRLTAPKVAAALASTSPAAALEWALGTPPGAHGEQLAEDAMRYALRAGSWDGLGAAAHLVPDTLPGGQRRRYWQARAAEARAGAPSDQARETYRAVRAEERSYYAFLAADRVGMPYDMQHAPLVPSPADRTAAEQDPGLRRAREFERIGEVLESRREFAFSTARMAPGPRAAAAQLAASWGWHTLAITALAQAGAWNDLELRFPVIHREQFEATARGQRVDPAWLFAIARQESAMNPGARSPAGALGLMQVMPATAQMTARKAGIRYAGSADLLNPATNVQIGGRYMRLMLDDFQQNRILAAAAYNAGPGRVRQWLKRFPAPVDHDVFVETIPFRETRQYVQNVLSFAVIYAYLQGRSEPLVRPGEEVIHSNPLGRRGPST